MSKDEVNSTKPVNLDEDKDEKAYREISMNNNFEELGER